MGQSQSPRLLLGNWGTTVKLPNRTVPRVGEGRGVRDVDSWKNGSGGDQVGGFVCFPTLLVEYLSQEHNAENTGVAMG